MSGGRAHVLDEAGGPGAMTAVLGIMLFLTVLAAALGLAAMGGVRSLSARVAGRLTVQVVDGDPMARDRTAARVERALRALPGVERVAPVPPAELQRLIEPWLGREAASAGLPVPALIDVDLADGAAAPRVAAAVARAAPTARVDRHEAWMSPVSRFMDFVTGLSALLVTLTVGATLAVVALTVRSGLERHRDTIDVMRVLGSTDVQVARLFQRRILLDAALGGGAGGLLALGLVWLLGRRLGALGSELLGGGTLGPGGWAALAALPPLFALLAVLAARRAVLGHLKRAL